MPYFEIDMMINDNMFCMYTFWVLLFLFFSIDIIMLFDMIYTMFKMETMKNSMNKTNIISFFFLIIFMLNLIGGLPFNMPFTTHFFMSMSFSIFSYFLNLYMKTLKKAKLFLLFKFNNFDKTHGMDVNTNVDSFLMWIMKIFTLLGQMLTLGGRLCMNTTAGHLIFSIYNNDMKFVFFYLPFEVFIGFMQSYVFTMLSNMYFY